MFRYKDSLAFGSHLAISVTNGCPLTCAHCISRSGPNGQRASPQLSKKVGEMLDVSPFATNAVSLTGGEPFYEPDTLADLIKEVKKRGHRVIVITSAFWAKNYVSARGTLLSHPGIDELVLSHDTFHNRQVSVAFLKNAYLAARDLDIRAKIRLVRHSDPTEAERAAEESVREFAAPADIEMQRLIRYGRAADKQIEGAGFSSLERNVCPSSGPHISHDGTVTPCCNSITSIRGSHALTLGNILEEDFRLIYERMLRNRLLAALKLEGAAFFREALRAVVGDEVDCMSICDLCFVVCSNPRALDSLQGLINTDHYALSLYSFALIQMNMSEFGPVLLEVVNANVGLEQEDMRAE